MNKVSLKRELLDRKEELDTLKCDHFYQVLAFHGAETEEEAELIREGLDGIEEAMEIVKDEIAGIVDMLCEGEETMEKDD